MPASATCKVCPQFASPGCGSVFACGLYASQFVVRSPERRSSDHPPAPTITAFEVPTLLQALVKLGNSPHRESEGRRRRFGSHTYNIQPDSENIANMIHLKVDISVS